MCMIWALTLYLSLLAIFDNNKPMLLSISLCVEEPFCPHVTTTLVWALVMITMLLGDLNVLGSRVIAT